MSTDTIDALAFEPHFLDHLAPVWHALPESIRGTFYVEHNLVQRAVRHGIAAVGMSALQVKSGQRLPPTANPRPGPLALTAGIGDIKLGRRDALGYTRFVFLEHGIGQSYGGERRRDLHPSYAGGRDREDVELFLVPNEHAAERWRRAYPQARVSVVGCPKLDWLPAREPGPAPVVAVSFHWNCPISPEASSGFRHFQPALGALAERFAVIGHGHPRGLDGIRPYYARLGIPVVSEFEDVCRQADVYVCDNSSTMYEFAATGRPVVVLNPPQYRRSIHHGLRFWEAATVGCQVADPGDLARTVEHALEDCPTHRDNREAALNVVYAHRSGGAHRAADSIADLMGAAEVAA